MRIVTWNVNSIRIRIDRLVAFLARHQPDALCLQELKVVEADFPYEAIAAAGYQAAVLGQKTYNGVAILTRQPVTVLHRGMDDGEDDPQARLLDVQLGPTRVISVYVPNGSEVGSEKYAYKRRWLQRLAEHLRRTASPGDDLCVCGDYNIAPEARDVRNPAAWQDSILFSAEMKADWDALLAWGLQDAFRAVRPESGLFSWWDYRNLGFVKNDGLRIDHVLATASLTARAKAASIDRDERKGEKPSDHAPVIVDFGP